MSGEALLALSLPLSPLFLSASFSRCDWTKWTLKEARSYAVNIKIYALPVFRPLKHTSVLKSKTAIWYPQLFSVCIGRNAEQALLFFIGCSARVDLAFIIDGSGSIEAYGRGNFRRCLNFVKAIVSRFNINNGQTRIGVVLFSSRPRLIFDFRRYRRKNQILNAINRIRYPRGGTKTGYAMRYCYSRVFRYARRGVRKVKSIFFRRKEFYCVTKS